MKRLILLSFAVFALFLLSILLAPQEAKAVMICEDSMFFYSDSCITRGTAEVCGNGGSNSYSCLASSCETNGSVGHCVQDTATSCHNESGREPCDWVEATPTPLPPGVPPPTGGPPSCTEHCSGTVCVPNWTPGDSCGCAGCNRTDTYEQRTAPAAVVFIDNNGDGLFEPDSFAGHGDRFVYTPGNSTTYPGGLGTKVCGSKVNGLNQALGNMTISYYGTNSDGSVSQGDLTPVCYFQQENNGANCKSWSGGCCGGTG